MTKIIYVASIQLFFLHRKGYKVGKILLAALAIIVGIIITTLFSIEIDRFSQAFFSCNVHAKCKCYISNAIMMSCMTIIRIYTLGDLVTVEALLITGGVISTLMSGCLFVEAIKSK